jgi:hypothetical protein
LPSYLGDDGCAAHRVPAPGFCEHWNGNPEIVMQHVMRRLLRATLLRDERAEPVEDAAGVGLDDLEYGFERATLLLVVRAASRGLQDHCLMIVRGDPRHKVASRSIQVDAPT